VTRSRSRRPRGVPAVALALLLPASVCAAAGASWSYHEQEPADAWRVLWSDYSFFTVLGKFPEGDILLVSDGGFESDYLMAPLPVPLDSVQAVSSLPEEYLEMSLLSVDGRLWRFGGPWWQDYPPPTPDSLGTVTALELRSYRAWYGTSQGVLMETSSDRLWTDLPPVAIRGIHPFDPDSALVLLEDGRLLAPDSTWIEAPCRAALVNVARRDYIHVLERGTHHLWKSTDAGRRWTLASTALASAELAPWAARARRFEMRESGFGVLACGDALLVTEDDGQSWQKAGEGPGMFLDVAIGDQQEILTVGSRIHRSPDHGHSLRQMMGAGFTHIEIPSATTLWALDEGLLLSGDAGDSWLRIPLPLPGASLRHIAATGDYDLRLHFDGPEGSSSYSTSDRGNTFVPLDPAGRLHGIRDWAFPGGLAGWASTDSSLLRSADAGDRWSVAATFPSGVEGFAARDSLRAAAWAQEGIHWTDDGGRTWSTAARPPMAHFQALAYAGDSTLVAVGDGAWRIPGWPPRDPVPVWPSSDTLLAVAIDATGEGWAVGRGGRILRVGEAGATWERYTSDLRINGIEEDLVGCGVFNGRHAAACGGGIWLTCQPDGGGPQFRIGIAPDPYFGRTVDIHVTAHERLLGDTLAVSVDEVPVPSALIDPGGFLYAARAVLSPDGGDHLLSVRGSDVLGNESSTMRGIHVHRLRPDGGGPASARWPLLIEGPAGAVVGLLELDGEAPSAGLPQGDRPWSLIQVACGEALIVRPAGPGTRLSVWDGHAWSAPGSGPVEISGGGTLAVRNDAALEPALDAPLLRVHPVPSRGRCWVSWAAAPSGPTGPALRWSLYDLLGREISRGERRAGSEPAWAWEAIDASGRPLASGVYWLRVGDGRRQATRRLLIAR
jgi:photosystem II stability/assembly factor-like uncharacterized protein